MKYIKFSKFGNYVDIKELIIDPAYKIISLFSGNSPDYRLALRAVHPIERSIDTLIFGSNLIRKATEEGLI